MGVCKAESEVSPSDPFQHPYQSNQPGNFEETSIQGQAHSEAYSSFPFGAQNIQPVLPP